jgi:NADP-dependent 3-hydroxy acid dehydrogenase YdfG
MSNTIAVFGVGPGMGRSIARRFGREGFQVALVARNPTRLDTFAGELAADGIEAARFAGDIADRDVLPGMIEAITARFGPIDVLEYAPSGLDLLNAATPIRDADASSFELPLDLMLRTPVTLIRQVLPGMFERGDGAVLFGLPVTASVPVPPFGNLATAAAASRHYLHTLHTDLAGTGVYAGLLQISGPVRDSDAGNYVLENYDPALLPEPQDPADLADAMWDLYLKRDRFEEMS